MAVKPGDPVWVDGFERSAGSVGVRVFDDCGDFAGPLLLTVAHAVGSLSPARDVAPAEVFSQPAQLPFLPDRIHGQRIGRVVRSLPPRLPAGDEIDLDAALIELSGDVEYDNQTPLGPLDRVAFDFETEIEDTFADIAVHKVGAATGITHGQLFCTPEQANVRFTGLNRSLLLRGLYDAFSDEGDFAHAGDSGGVVFDDYQRPLGIIQGARFGGAPPRIAVCMPLARVLETFRVHL